MTTKIMCANLPVAVRKLVISLNQNTYTAGEEAIEIKYAQLYVVKTGLQVAAAAFRFLFDFSAKKHMFFDFIAYVVRVDG